MIIIFGVMGCCRGEKIVNVLVKHVTKEGKLLLAAICTTKNDQVRQFTINAKLSKIVKKYQALRPAEISTSRFFINCRNNSCTKQPIGKNKIANVPKQIVIYLELEDPASYTGHALRRSSETLLSNAGGSMMGVQHLRGWKSVHVAQRYIDNSLLNKTRIGNLVAKNICDQRGEQPATGEILIQESRTIKVKKILSWKTTEES